MESKKRTLQTMSPLKIGNVEMQNPLVLAPMAGVTDLPFRVLCKELSLIHIYIMNNTSKIRKNIHFTP